MKKKIIVDRKDWRTALEIHKAILHVPKNDNELPFFISKNEEYVIEYQIEHRMPGSTYEAKTHKIINNEIVEIKK